MFGILIAVIFAAIVYLVAAALGLPYAVCLIAALLVLLGGIGYGWGGWRGGPPA